MFEYVRHSFSTIEIPQLHFLVKMYLSELFRRTASNPLYYQALKKVSICSASANSSLMFQAGSPMYCICLSPVTIFVEYIAAMN